MSVNFKYKLCHVTIISKSIINYHPINYLIFSNKGYTISSSNQEKRWFLISVAPQNAAFMKNLTVAKLKCTWNKYNNNENN